jgi:hypothetical protein
MADRDENLPWSALTFVLAAGGVALLFVGVGWWLSRRSFGNAPGSPLAAPLASGSFGALPAGLWTPDAVGEGPRGLLTPTPRQGPPARRHDTNRRPDIEQTPRIESFSVGTSAVEVVSRSAAGSRRVKIATDQPIRLGNGSGVAAAPERGLPISAGDQPFDLGVLPPGARFFAVVPPGGSAANVTVISQLVG